MGRAMMAGILTLILILLLAVAGILASYVREFDTSFFIIVI